MFFWGAPLVSCRPVDEMRGVCGARSRLVDLWVMQGIVMDEMQHLFPRRGVSDLLRVC